MDLVIERLERTRDQAAEGLTFAQANLTQAEEQRAELTESIAGYRTYIEQLDAALAILRGSGRQKVEPIDLGNITFGR